MPTPVISLDIRRTAKAALAMALATAQRPRGFGGDIHHLRRLRLVQGGATTAGQILAASEDRHGRA